MTQKEIDNFLAETKVYVNGKSKEIQKKLFSLGYKWSTGNTKVDYIEAPFLFIYTDMSISKGSNMAHFSYHKNREITADEILSLKLTGPKYRPFKDGEECWNEMLKHQPFGWITLKGGKHPGSKAFIIKLTENCFYYIGDGNCATYNLYNYEFDRHLCFFADGTPFGIKED